MKGNGKSNVTGRCLCGGCAYTYPAPECFDLQHCHCSMCRRSHGAAFVTWFAVPHDRFFLDPGHSAKLVEFASSEHGKRFFCGRCGSSLFCEIGDPAEDMDIVLANMHGPIDREPEMHMFFDDRVAWTQVDAQLPRLGGPTGLEPIEWPEPPGPAKD